jgi:hypothetical protein
MPRWKKNQTVFLVAVNYYDKRGAQSPIPKPVAQFLGNPYAIFFALKDGKVEVYPADRPLPRVLSEQMAQDPLTIQETQRVKLEEAKKLGFGEGRKVSEKAVERLNAAREDERAKWERENNMLKQEIERLEKENEARELENQRLRIQTVVVDKPGILLKTKMILAKPRPMRLIYRVSKGRAIGVDAESS